MGDKLNPEAYLNNFKNLVPLGSLDGILGSATNKFETVKNMISGNGLSGIAQGINAIFWLFITQIYLFSNPNVQEIVSLTHLIQIENLERCIIFLIVEHKGWEFMPQFKKNYNR